MNDTSNVLVYCQLPSKLVYIFIISLFVKCQNAPDSKFKIQDTILSSKVSKASPIDTAQPKTKLNVDTSVNQALNKRFSHKAFDDISFGINCEKIIGIDHDIVPGKGVYEIASLKFLVINATCDPEYGLYRFYLENKTGYSNYEDIKADLQAIASVVSVKYRNPISIVNHIPPSALQLWLNSSSDESLPKPPSDWGEGDYILRWKNNETTINLGFYSDYVKIKHYTQNSFGNAIENGFVYNRNYIISIEFISNVIYGLVNEKRGKINKEQKEIDTKKF